MKKKGIDKIKRFLSDKFPVLIGTLVILVFLFILFSITNPTGKIITGDVSLQEQSGMSTTSFIADFFTNWSQGNLDVNIAKYLFFFMLAALIWSVLSFAKFPPNAFFQAVIAIPVAFLATAFITPAEIFTILQGYTTLGIVLTFIIPFIVMLFFSAMLTSNEKIREMSIPKIMLEFFLWLFFVAVLGYKMISGFFTGQVSFGLNLTIIIMVAVFFISSLILIFNSKFREWVWRIGAQIRKAQSVAERQIAEEAIRTAKAIEKARGKK